MEIKKVIGENLSKLQEEYDYSQQELGEILGVTRQTVAKYLNGERVLDSDKLYRLANHFNKSVDYFLTSENENDKLAFMFRADDPENNFSQSLHKRISKRFNVYHELIELSDAQIKDYIPEEYDLNLKGEKLSSREKEAIEQIAHKQRRYMGIEEAINVNLFSLFEENNINVVAEEIKAKNLDAASAYSKDKGAFIFINDSRDIPEERKIFSLVHELGHLIMHRDEYSKEIEELKYTNSKLKDIREKAADYFAMSFLIPREVLKRSYGFEGYIYLETIIDKKQDFGISARCLITALNKYEMIEDNVLGYLFSELRKKGFKEKEPEPREYIKKNKKLNALVRNLIIKDKLTINKAAEALNASVLEMRKQAKRWKNSGYRSN